MEKTETSAKKKKHGGARSGAGRPKGSKNTISVHQLLDQIHQQANGQDYEELLIRDFLEVRNGHNKELLLKYHHLILNKVMNTLAKVEVTDSADTVEAKKQAFAEALAKLTGVKQE